jgi:hypothetical protein
MSEIINCERCGYSTNRTSNLYRHLSKKNKCKPLLSDISTDELINKLDRSKNDISEVDGNKIFKCQYCNSIYYHTSSRYRHELNCNKKDLLNEIKNINNKYTGIINELIKNGLANTLIQNTNNGIINNITNPTINNYNGDFYITNLDEFNAKMLNDNSKHILNIGSYLVDKFIEDKCKVLTECIQECKKEALTEFNYSIVTKICKVILESDNPLTKNMFMDNSDDSHAYINLNGRFYWIHLNDLVELFCIHIPEVIKKLVKYKDTLDEMDPDDKDFVKFELSRFLSLTLDERKKEIIDLLTKHLLENKKLIEDFLQKAIPIDELKKLKPSDKFIFTIREKKLAEIEFRKLNSRSDDLKPKRLRQLKTYETIVNNDSNGNLDFYSESDYDNDELINNLDIYIDDDNKEFIIYKGNKYTKRSYATITYWFDFDNYKGFLCNSSHIQLLPFDKLKKKIENKLGDTFPELMSKENSCF